MSTLKAIFCNPRIEKEVFEVHKAIAEQHAGLTLAQAFMVGNSWSASKVQRTLEDGVMDKLVEFHIETWEYDDSKESLSEFQLYNTREIQNAWIRAKFLKRLNTHHSLAEFIHKDPAELSGKDAQKLEDLSLMAYEYPSLLMPLKGFICANEIEETFTGLVPNTSPARRGVQRLFDEDIVSNYAHTNLCTKIGEEIQRNPTFVNTVFWIKGK